MGWCWAGTDVTARGSVARVLAGRGWRKVVVHCECVCVGGWQQLRVD